MVSVVVARWLVRAAAARAAFLEAPDWNTAVARAEALSLQNIVSGARPVLKQIAVTALLFGAARITPVDKTRFGSGAALPLTVIDAALDQLTVMVEDDGGDRARSWLMAKAGDDLPQHATLFDGLSGFVSNTIAANCGMVLSRVVSLGFLEEAVFTGIQRYTVDESLDAPTCEICSAMEGRLFNAAVERGRIEQLLTVADPAELILARPWPRASVGLNELLAASDDQHQSEGLGAPPYHPFCRGLLARPAS